MSALPNESAPSIGPLAPLSDQARAQADHPIPISHELLAIMDQYQLTLKEARAVVAHTSGLSTSKTGAARVAGYACPNVEAPRLFARPKVNRAISAILEEAGVSEDRIASKTKELLDARRLVFDKQGRAHVVPDNATQATVLRLAMECFDWLKSASVNINVDTDAMEQLSQARALLKRYDEALGTGQGEGGASSKVSKESLPESRADETSKT